MQPVGTGTAVERVAAGARNEGGIADAAVHDFGAAAAFQGAGAGTCNQRIATAAAKDLIYSSAAVNDAGARACLNLGDGTGGAAVAGVDDIGAGTSRDGVAAVAAVDSAGFVCVAAQFDGFVAVARIDGVAACAAVQAVVAVAADDVFLPVPRINNRRLARAAFAAADQRVVAAGAEYSGVAAATFDVVGGACF